MRYARQVRDGGVEVRTLDVLNHLSVAGDGRYLIRRSGARGVRHCSLAHLPVYGQELYLCVVSLEDIRAVETVMLCGRRRCARVRKCPDSAAAMLVVEVEVTVVMAMLAC